MKKLLAIPFLFFALLSFASTLPVVNPPTPDLWIMIVNGHIRVYDDGDDCNINISIHTDDYSAGISYSLCD